MSDKVDLVKVEKDGVVLEVNPVALKEHQDLGWTLAAKDAKPTELDEGEKPKDTKK